MYLPSAFEVDDHKIIRNVLRQTAFGHLVTTNPLAPEAALECTALPFIVNDDLTILQAHFSRANTHWKTADRAKGILIVPVNDGYISPRWYPSKVEHGKVVPTWNYELIHLHGTVEIHHDTGWKRALVSELTDQQERRVQPANRTEPWKVSDAPSEFIDGQLKAIVGMEFKIQDVQAKRKLSQNKPEADRLGAIEGLSGSTRRNDTELAQVMQASPASDATDR